MVADDCDWMGDTVFLVVCAGAAAEERPEPVAGEDPLLCVTFVAGDASRGVDAEDGPLEELGPTAAAFGAFGVSLGCGDLNAAAEA